MIAAVKEANVRFKREININAGTEEEYTKRAVIQAQKISSYKQKIQLLE